MIRPGMIKQDIIPNQIIISKRDFENSAMPICWIIANPKETITDFIEFFYVEQARLEGRSIRVIA